MKIKITTIKNMDKSIKDINEKIKAIDERIKTIENRRGSPQDKYRAYESLTKERDQLISELSKFSK